MIYLCYKVDGDRMKKWFKENKFYIISFLIMIIISSLLCYRYFKNHYMYREVVLFKNDNFYQTYESCVNYNVPLNDGENCNEVIITYNDDYDMFYHFGEIINNNSIFFAFYSCLFIMLPAIYVFNKKTKKGNIKNQLTRSNYKDFLKKEYRNSLKAALILPCTMLFILLICGLCTSFKVMDPNKFQFISYYFYPLLNKQFVFVAFLIATIFIQSIFFINIAYIINYYCKNLILTILGCYISFYIIELCLEAVSAITVNVFDVSSSLAWVLTLTTVWDYYLIDSLWLPLIVNLVYMIISYLIMKFVYRSKEKMVMNCE